MNVSLEDTDCGRSFLVSSGLLTLPMSDDDSEVKTIFASLLSVTPKSLAELAKAGIIDARPGVGRWLQASVASTCASRQRKLFRTNFGRNRGARRIVIVGEHFTNRSQHHEPSEKRASKREARERQPKARSEPAEQHGERPRKLGIRRRPDDRSASLLFEDANPSKQVSPMPTMRI